MPIGVYVSCDDPFLADALATALGGDPECYAAVGEADADVLIAEPHLIPDEPHGAVIVLALSDPVAAARFALARGADGLAVWPDEPASVARIVRDAAARRATDAGGLVVSVIGSRGGAGASTIVAHLAAALAPGVLIVDADGGPAGQALFARSEPPVTLTEAAGVVAEPSVRALTAIAAPHAAGVACLYGGTAPPPLGDAAIACARGLAKIVVADGAVAGPDVTVLVCGADVGSVRAAAMIRPAGRVLVVVNAVARGRVRSRDVRRALGVDRVFVVPQDPRLTRASDRGRVARRGPGRRAIARIARQILGGGE